MKKIIFFYLYSFVFIYAEEVYELKYSHDTNCTLLKNGKSIDLFDSRFKVKEPKTSYTCSAIQKEQFRNCIIENKENISALVFTYGVYEITNLVISFKVPTKYINASIKVKCTKEIKEFHK